MPSWLVQFILDEILKIATPETLQALLKKLEGYALAHALCAIKKAVVANASPSVQEVVLPVLQVVAQDLGVDLAQCA